MCVCVCVCACMNAGMFVLLPGRWVFRRPLPVHVKTDGEWRSGASWSDETRADIKCS